MPKAVITLSDEEGGVGMTVFLEDGFTPTSEAHCATNMLVKHMETMSEKFSAGETKWVEGDEAGWIQGDVVALPSTLSSIMTTDARLIAG